MELTQEQKKTVAGWAAAGDSAAEIQNQLASEFGLSMTYMEVRFLIDDLSLQLKDREAEKTVEPPDITAETDAGAEAAESGGGNVKISVDRLTTPGAVVSGNVTFSDGVDATWALDALGRLALTASSEGYRPSEADLQSFQEGLENELRKTGYMPDSMGP